MNHFVRALLPLAAVAIASCSGAKPDSASSAASPPAESAAPVALAVAAPPPVSIVPFSGCVSPREQAAFEVYALRIEVLAGAQSCRMTPQFNAFAVRFRGELTTEGKALRGYYQKTYGKRGDAAIDEFLTQLANVSFVNGSNAGDYCAKTKRLLESLMTTPVGKLASFSAEHRAPSLPTMNSCEGVPAKKG